MKHTLQYYTFEQYRCAFIEYQNTGQQEAPDTLLMLHNGMMDHRLFDKQITFFSAHYRVIAIDFLGYGASDQPDITYNTALYVEQIKALLLHLNIQQCHLMGCCVGGAVAVEFALKYPKKVTTLTAITLDAPEVVDAGILGQLSKGTPFGSQRHKLGSRAMRSTIGRKIFKTFMKKHQMGEYYGIEPDWDNTFNAYYANKNNLRTFSNLDVEDCNLRHLKRPSAFPKTFILWGEKNTILPASTGEQWAKEFKADDIKIYPNSGYMILRENAESVNQDILSFLNKIYRKI